MIAPSRSAGPDARGLVAADCERVRAMLALAPSPATQAAIPAIAAGVSAKRLGVRLRTSLHNAKCRGAVSLLIDASAKSRACRFCTSWVS